MILTFGEKIDLLCKNKGILNKDLANSLNITTQYLSKLKNGHDTPSNKLLKQIADFFDVPISYFLDNVETQRVDEVEDVWNKLPSDIKQWIIQTPDNAKPFLILAHMADTTTIPAEQIATLIEALRKAKSE